METPDWIPLVGGAGRPEEPFLERAGDWAAALSYGDIPRPVRRAARAQLTSGVGAALRTRIHPIGDRIWETIEPTGGDTTVLGCGRAAPATAAVGNGALASALAFDGSILGGRTAASCVFVPLAYAEAAGADGEDLLTAQVAANEIAGRLGAAIPTGPFAAPGTAWIHAAGAATGRAVIEGDDPTTLANALATALSDPPQPIDGSALGSESGVWRASAPIRTGLAAVESARSGIEGPTDLIESDDGLLSELCRRPARGHLFDFGERWHTAALSVKDVPGSVYVAAATEAALAARGRLDRGRTTVARVEVYGPQALRSMDSAVRPYLDGDRPPLPAVVCSTRRATAEALVDGEIIPEQIGTGTKRERVQRITDRIKLGHDPELTIAALRSSIPEGIEFDRTGRSIGPRVARAVGARATLKHPRIVLGTGGRLTEIPDPSSMERLIGARVAVRTADGRTFQGAIERPSGIAGAPLAEIRAVAQRKCRESLEALGVSESTARSRTDRLSRIDEESEIRLGWLSDGM